VTKIDFYVLGPGRGSRHLFACRIAEKAWRQGLRVLIHTNDQQETESMDSLLWSFSDQSFLPHGRLGQADPAANPILVGHADDPADEHQLLINLASDLPTWFSRFERVAECIDQEPQVKTAGRERFRFYREHGYPMDTHQLD
jgi:DNA polymerase-3 subunit chi